MSALVTDCPLNATDMVPHYTFGDACAVHFVELTIFLDPKKIGSVEIADSQRREFHNTFGWTWMTRIQAQGGEINGTFAIFIAGNTIVDARRGVLIDRCEGLGLNYQPLDLRPPEANQVVKKRRRESTK